MGSGDTFDLRVLSGLFFIVVVGVFLSVVVVLLETVHVAYVDSKSEERSFLACLLLRLKLKKQEILGSWREKVNRIRYTVALSLDEVKELQEKLAPLQSMSSASILNVGAKLMPTKTNGKILK